MRKTLFLVILLIREGVVLCQSNPNTISVYFKEKMAYARLPVDKNGVITITAVSDAMILNFPRQDTAKLFLNYSIQFNKADSSKFSLSFNCTDSNCIPLLLEDIKDNALKLVFKNNELTGISGRLINAKRRKLIPDKSGPYVQILVADPKVAKNAKADDPYALLDSVCLGKQGNLPVPDTGGQNIFYCSNFKCPSCNRVTDKNNTGEFDTVISNFNYEFFKPSGFKGKSGRAVTAEEVILYDLRKQGQARPGVEFSDAFTYLKFKNHSAYESMKIKKQLHPRVNTELLIAVIGLKDSVYIIDSSSKQYYMESAPSFTSAIQSLVNPTTGSSGTTSKDSSASKTTGGTNPNARPPVEKPQALVDSQKVANDYKTTQDPEQKINYLNGLGLFSEAAYKKLLNSKELYPVISVMADNYVELYEKLLAKKDSLKALDTQYQSIKMDIDKAQDSIVTRKTSDTAKTSKRIKDLKQSLDSTSKSIGALSDRITSIATAMDDTRASMLTLDKTLLLKKNLLLLEKALEVFNHDFETIDFREKQYGNALLCLKRQIIDVFGIAIPDSAKDLAKLLVNIAATSSPCEFYPEFKNIISTIQTEYAKAISKTSRYALFTKSFQVPNSDLINITAHTPKGADNIFQKSYYIRGGLKIDFSTGLFFNGLSSTDFILGKHTFLYKVTMDTITTGGAVDTIYTGKIKDTTGNLIQSNTNKYSYSVGFLAHIYVRSGRFLNLGIATGIALSSNNNSPIDIMLGPTLMFGDGSSRISFTGGIIMGQQKTVSSEAGPYFWNAKSSPDNQLFNSVYEVPVFYSGSNDIPTYYRWKTSWYIGISYNFATLKIGK